MKRIFPVLGFLAILILACNLPTTVPPGVATESAETNTPTVPPIPTFTATSTSEANASCNELSFYLDPSLATSYHCETVPASISPTDYGTFPQYTKVSLVGYVLSDRAAEPVISVFPVDQFQLLLPGLINSDVSTLLALIASGTPGSSEPPYLLPAPAHELFTAQFAVTPFHNGSGFRFLTEIAQNIVPVNNHDMIFSYQGLTSDGRYWISIILPISHPSLPETGDNPPAAFNNNATTYYTQITNQLNAEPPESFIPSIVTLTSLINSITVTP
jgi:hypothetical protein